jgi:hypothetical protein
MSIDPPPNPSAPMPFSTLFRPGTVTAAGVILYIGAALSLIVSCLVFVAADDTSDTSLAMTTAVIYGIAGLGNAVLAFFLMRGKRWARVVTIVLCGIGVLFSLVSVLTGAGSPSSCIGAALNAVVIGLLLSASANEYFSKV